ncbi:transcription-repair coupling factor [Leptospira bandrabouensis]|nr:transcription-repair coupling factor [Leptospira bandrabouensis]MCG6144733.1 transcription-repair coupling factor [Leptospira bandrabouensis]MCG6161635.1 transcription-repair coupling factor [Leptospira bandrabouensis]MCG6164562.1 transcription-repair coupling factor [Leptospira bandrabouensis]
MSKETEDIKFNPKQVLADSKSSLVNLSGIPEPAHSFTTASLYKTLSSDLTFLVVLPTNQDAESFSRELLSFLPQEEIFYFPGPENIPYEYTKWQMEWKRDRILTINRILSGNRCLVVTSVSALLRKLPVKESLKGKSITLKLGKDFPLDKLLSELVNLGYHREEVCEQFGHFSLKGGILDIYTPYLANPVRIDFFGDTVDEIRTFDPNTQKSITKIQEIIITAANETIISRDEKTKYQEILADHKDKRLPIDSELEIIEEHLPFIREHEGFLNFFLKEPILIFPRYFDTKERSYGMEREYNTLYEKKKEESLCLKPDDLLSFGKEWESLTSENTPGIRFSLLPDNQRNFSYEPIAEVRGFRGKIREAKEYFLELLSEDPKNKIFITSSFSAQMMRLKGLFSEGEIETVHSDSEDPHPLPLHSVKPGIHLVISDLKRGFHIVESQVYIFTDNDLFGRQYKRKTRYKKQASQMIESFIDLKEGDYVVHVNHGVGRFIKIERTKADGKERDFLKLEYAGGDSLFVPLDQISLVQKYIGGTDTPKLDTLGKNSWKKAKDRVQESVDKLAEELVLLYSNRLKLNGFAFPPDTIWQEEFEAAFEFEETPDQISAIEAVKQDLESMRPMDRLVCGDVGYGKTEVAIRAAFKVIMAGKQVMLLTPTTILSLQHFNTFKSRYENYPIKIAFVSRFRTAAEIKEDLKNFSEGKIDMLIGTHAILSSKVKPKNLGLLIIDEEQKFGVTHKEAIKKFKNLVDVLTLTATPIPRTLHMALTGIRELSIISTPPKNRQSVETYVLEEDDTLIQEAIRKEIERDGQVFYLYNRVESIEEEAAYIRSLVPEISVGILHGQLTEDEIEETLVDFYERKYDILVTTTIIESGIDMPNVNTLIVKRADMFGLSQLYQIRGRVGRSDRKAYAYMFYPSKKLMTELAEKRLNTIFEYQELGSGFKVAMRDLEIRGAGNLLGKEQSGDIMEVGFDLYVKMLEEAISRIKGEEVRVEVRTAVNLKTNFYLPDDYIPDTKQKIEFYKRFEGSANLDEIEEISLEMEDRFGELPQIAKTFVELEKIRTLASNLGFEFVTEKPEEILFKCGTYFRGNPDRVIQAMSKFKGLTIAPQEPSVLRYTIPEREDLQKIKKLLSLLEFLAA